MNEVEKDSGPLTGKAPAKGPAPRTPDNSGCIDFYPVSDSR